MLRAYTLNEPVWSMFGQNGSLVMTFPRNSGHSRRIDNRGKNVQMTEKLGRIFTGEQKAEAVRISARVHELRLQLAGCQLLGCACRTRLAPAGHVTQSGKAVSHGAKEKDLWGRQSLLGEEAGGRGLQRIPTARRSSTRDWL